LLARSGEAGSALIKDAGGDAAIWPWADEDAEQRAPRPPGHNDNGPPV